MVDDDNIGDDEESGDAESGSQSSHGRIPPPPDFSYSRPSLKGSSSAAGPVRDGTDPAESEPRRAGRMMGAGLTLASGVLGGALIGVWLDSHFGKPGSYLWSIILTLVGAAGGFMNLLRMIRGGNGSG